MALVAKNAALLVRDDEAVETLIQSHSACQRWQLRHVLSNTVQSWHCRMQQNNSRWILTIAKKWWVAFLKYRKSLFPWIGGIGMSALARFFVAEGKPVAGTTARRLHSQRSFSRKYGNSLYDDPALVQLIITILKEPLSFILLPFRQTWMSWHSLKSKGHIPVNGRRYWACCRVKGKTVAVAGTHGKTTVSTMKLSFFHPLPKVATHSWEV